MGTSLRKAADVVDVVGRTHWTLFASLGRLKDDRADAAQRFVRELTEAMVADEYAVALGHRLPDLENRAVDLLARPVEPPPPTPPPTPPPPPGKGGASVREGAIVDEGSHSDLDRERLRAVTTRLEALFRRADRPTRAHLEAAEAEPATCGARGGRRMTGVPSFAQVRAQVKSIRDRYPDARAIGIRMPMLDEATPAPSVLRIGSEEFPVIRCGSVLALRECFVELPAAGAAARGADRSFAEGAG